MHILRLCSSNLIRQMSRLFRHLNTWNLSSSAVCEIATRTCPCHFTSFKCIKGKHVVQLHNKCHENETWRSTKSDFNQFKLGTVTSLLNLSEKAIFCLTFKFIVCYLFFVLFLGEIDYKERIRKPYRSCSLRFSTMFLILDENKHGCSNVLSVTLCFEQNRHRMGDKSSVSAFGTYSVPAGWLTETGN